MQAFLLFEHYTYHFVPYHLMKEKSTSSLNTNKSLLQTNSYYC